MHLGLPASILFSTIVPVFVCIFLSYFLVLVGAAWQVKRQDSQAHGRLPPPPLLSSAYPGTCTACCLCSGWATGRRRLAETERARLTQLPRPSVSRPRAIFKAESEWTVMQCRVSGRRRNTVLVSVSRRLPSLASPPTFYRPRPICQQNIVYHKRSGAACAQPEPVLNQSRD